MIAWSAVRHSTTGKGWQAQNKPPLLRRTEWTNSSPQKQTDARFLNDDVSTFYQPYRLSPMYPRRLYMDLQSPNSQMEKGGPDRAASFPQHNSDELEVERDLSCDRPRRNVVRTAESGKEVVERHLVHQVDDG